MTLLCQPVQQAQNNINDGWFADIFCEWRKHYYHQWALAGNIWLHQTTLDHRSTKATDTGFNDLRQVVQTHVSLSPSSIIWYRLHRWNVNRHIVRHTLAAYPWSRSVKTGLWLRAKKMEISAALWAVSLRKDFKFYVKWLISHRQSSTLHANGKHCNPKIN